jgi:glycosyltransferase involved in cell wall biosynthesis
MKRVAFTLIGGNNWTGGYNYFFNLLKALTSFQTDRITPVLFVGEQTEKGIESLIAMHGVEVVVTPLLNASRRRVSLAQALCWGRDSGMQKLFMRHHVDLVFENAQFWGWRLGIPAIAWIPDFQHKVLPHLFSRGAWWKREIGFRMQVAAGRTIMLSSEDAREDCEHYYRSTRGRTRTVHFAVPPGKQFSIQDARAIADYYGLPEQFIFMPNQFWRHKNHLLVLEALAILKRRGNRIVVAASGKQVDPRDPGYFSAIVETQEKYGLQQELRLLGLIPYEHIGMLMRASIAMLNPSLFEGWSTTVEEARALNTPMVLSDLEVHKEQMGDQAIYFERNSAQSLADTLEQFVVVDESHRQTLAEHARVIAMNRFKMFSDDFACLAEECQQ